MAKKHAILLTWLVAIIALAALTLLLTGPSWSSPAELFVTTSAPENLPPAPGTNITLNGGGFSPATSLWLIPERSLRSATTATLETYGYPQHFIRRDDHLYVANGNGGFFIVHDLQAPVPSISGVLESGGQGLEIVLRQNEAVMAAGNSGLQIIDIRDEVNPQLLSVLKSVAPALSVASVGEIAYVAAGKAGVQIVDLSDPRNPQRLGQISNLPEAYKVCGNKELLIVATGAGGLIYDVSLPEQPRRLTQLPVAGGINTVMTQHGETLYWATKTLRESRLYSIDLSRPATPRVLTSAPLNGTPAGISSSDDQVAIALGSSGTQLFSLSGEDRLAPLQTIAAKIRTRFALALGRDLWVGDGSGKLLRLDQQGAAALTTPATLPDFSPWIPPLVTPHLFLLGDETGLSIYDRGEGRAPILLARLPIAGLVQQYLTADQRQLWLSIHNAAPLATGKLISVDISTLSAPRITAEIPLSNPPIIIGESGTTLVISTSAPDQPQISWHPLIKKDVSDFLHFIDISLPESPALFLTYPLADSSTGMYIADHSLVLMQQGGLFRVIDLTETRTPKELGSLQMPWLQGAAWSGPIKIVVKDKVAFIASPLGKIIAIDLQSPRQPKNLGVFSLNGPVNSLLITDHFLLAEVRKEGLVVIDLKNPLVPKLLGTIPLPGFMHRGTAQGESFWYVINDAKGLWSLPLPRRLQSSVVGTDQLIANLEQPPQPGAYCFWLTDQQNHIVVPGVTWISTKN